MKTDHYQTKTSQVEAVRVDTTNQEDVLTWISTNGGHARISQISTGAPLLLLWTRSAGRWVWVHPGSYVVKRDDGSFVSFGPDVFAETYEVVSDSALEETSSP